MGRRVVVTGMGLISALGNDHASSWKALLAGRRWPWLMSEPHLRAN